LVEPNFKKGPFLANIYIINKEVEIAKYTKKAPFVIYGFDIFFFRKLCNFYMRGFLPRKISHIQELPLRPEDENHPLCMKHKPNLTIHQPLFGSIGISYLS